MVVPKFRAWDKESQKMYEVKSIVYTLGSMLCVNRSALFPERTLYFEDTPVMQSTGLLDKNGKEIFEGDIVKTTRFFGRADETGGFYEYEKELIGIVKQLEGAWVIETGKGAVYLWSDIDENEILGNTWENPELLEEETDE